MPPGTTCIPTHATCPAIVYSSAYIVISLVAIVGSLFSSAHIVGKFLCDAIAVEVGRFADFTNFTSLRVTV